jgi:hypothetical protein
MPPRLIEVRRVLADPHLVLAAEAVGVLLAEYLYRTRGHPYTQRSSPVWLLVEPVVASAALAFAWRVQERLRLTPVLGLAAAFHLLWIALHLHLNVPPDMDVTRIYKPEGSALLHGQYPRSEYPPAAVVLFAAEAWLDPTHMATVNRLLMVPFQLVTVAAIWGLRTRYSGWLAAVVALWPMNMFHWEFRYDLVPTALLAAGLALALRGRWGWSGLALGVGAAAKWTPALSFAVLALWCLVAAGRPRWAGRLSVFFAAGLLVFYLPFLVWSPTAVAAAYTRQGGRTITGESLWYLVIRLTGLRHQLPGIPLPAGAPHWTDIAAVGVQAIAVLGLIAAGALVRSRPAAVALAAIAPVVFLLTNRIFSAQYLVLMLAAWAIALALLSHNKRQQAGWTAVALAATAANAFVFPFILWNRDKTWLTCAVVLFALSLALTTRIVAVACERRAPAQQGRSFP